jgi:hypothetical protein
VSNKFVVPLFGYCTMVYMFLSLCNVEREMLRWLYRMWDDCDIF